MQDTPVQKAARAKKKAVAVSPLSSVSGRADRRRAAGAASQTRRRATPIAAPITVPSAVTNVTDTDIEHEGTGSIQQTLQQRVPGIIISDAAGNPMRAEVVVPRLRRVARQRPLAGSRRLPEWRAHQRGLRRRRELGRDPSNAIARMSVVSNNPSFGLNALGGAVSILMKDGFSYQGGELDVMGGSFGRRQVGIQAGGASGNAGVYVAGEWFEDDGFRDFSESEVKRFYGDIGLKGTFAEVHFSLTAADNHFGATAAAPVELLERSWSNTFTSPQTTDLEVYMPTISASVKATDTLTFSGVGYYRRYKNRVVDGNVTEADECDRRPDAPASSASAGRGRRRTAPLQSAPTTPIDVAALGLDEPLARSSASPPRAAAGAASWKGRRSAKLFGLSEPVPRRRLLRSRPLQLQDVERARDHRAKVRGRGHRDHCQ